MIITIAAFLLLFGLVIFVHELGHFVVGKLAGVHVEEFGFGYPPKLFSLGTWRGTEYTVNAVPLGGFVRMGEEDDTRPDSMANQPWYIRASAYLAGPLMNLFLALVCYFVILVFGQQMYVGQVLIEEVAPNSPAQAVGLQPGDQVLSINDVEVESTLDLSRETMLSAGTEVTLTVQRDGETRQFSLVPRVDPPEGQGAMGVMIRMENVETVTVQYPLGQAIGRAFQRTWNTFRLIIDGFVGMIRGSVEPDVTGPVGLVQVTGEVARTGWVNLVELGALVSVNLFILNLLPFPPLDGFRILIVAVEVIRGKRVPPQKEGVINAIGMLILLALMFLITYRDIVRWISGESILR